MVAIAGEKLRLTLWEFLLKTAGTAKAESVSRALGGTYAAARDIPRFRLFRLLLPICSGPTTEIGESMGLLVGEGHLSPGTLFARRFG